MRRRGRWRDRHGGRRGRSDRRRRVGSTRDGEAEDKERAGEKDAAHESL